MNYTLTNTKDAPAAATVDGTEKLLALVGGVVTTITPALVAGLSQPSLTGLADVPGLVAALAAKANTADLPTNLAADFLRLELANPAPTPVEGKGFFWIGLGTHPNSYAVFVRYNTGAKYRILDNLAANAIAGLPMDDDVRDFERGVFPVFSAEETGDEGPTPIEFDHYSREMAVVGASIGKFWLHLDRNISNGNGLVVEGARSGGWEALLTVAADSSGPYSSDTFVNEPQFTSFRLRFLAWPSGSAAAIRPILRVIERL